MKRLLISLAGMVCLFALLAGCAGEQGTNAPKVVTVNSVDELLAAIGPDTKIHMKAGTYNLQDASDYGAVRSEGYYTWDDRGDGYQLVLTGVQNLTIRGSGREGTLVETEPRYANVLALQDCTGVVLEGFATGHTEGGECSSGVVYLENCTDVALKNLGIFGCGTVGVESRACTDISLMDSEIYECAFYGIVAEQTAGLTVEGCTFHDLGDIRNGGGIVFRLSDSRDVSVTGCNISDNTVMHLIDCYPCDNVVFTDNSFAGNRVLEAALDVDSGMVFDSNVMEQNDIRSWFSVKWTTVLDDIGKSWDAEMLEWYYNPPAQSQPEWEQKQIRVKTVDEFLAAIGPDTEIILESELYDLSTAKEYGTGYSEYYYWSAEFDGLGLVITDVRNMTIRSESGDVKKCTISAVPRYAHVLSFRRCSDITFSGFTAGHTLEPGECSGGVLHFYDCDYVMVENCGLFGCGVLGIQAQLGGRITVSGCDIYECSYGGIQMHEVSGIVIEECTFRDLGGDSMAFSACKDVTVDGQSVANNARIS